MTKKKSKAKMMKMAATLAPLIAAKYGNQVGKKMMKSGPIPNSIVNQVSGIIDKKLNQKINKQVKSNKARRLIGSGSYSYNSLFSGSSDQSVMLSSAGDETGRIRIKHREFLGDLISPIDPSGFSNNTWSVNPGLGAIFVWLSQLAANYDQYRFIQLVFEFVPTVSSSTLSGAMGTLIVAFNYNAAASSFVSKREMIEYDGAVSCRPCDHLSAGVECETGKGSPHWLFVRAGHLPDGQDIKTYDLGTLQVATAGLPPSIFPPGVQLGEIYVQYTVELLKPKLYDSLGYALPEDMFYGEGGIATLPLGTLVYASNNNLIGGVISTIPTAVGGVTGSVYTFPDNFAGTVTATMYIRTTGAVVAPTFNFGGNIVPFADLTNDGATPSTYVSSGDGTAFVLLVVDMTVSRAGYPGGNRLVFGSGSYVGTGDVAWLRVTTINPLLGKMFNPSNFSLT